LLLFHFINQLSNASLEIGLKQTVKFLTMVIMLKERWCKDQTLLLKHMLFRWRQAHQWAAVNRKQCGPIHVQFHLTLFT